MKAFTFIAFALVTSLAACSKKTNDNQAGSAGSAAKTTDTTGSAAASTTPTPSTDTSAGSAAASPLAGDAVDVCAIVDKADIEKVAGKLDGEPTKDTPQGSLLGGCQYTTESGAVAVSARPAAEYEATAKSGDPKPLAGVGEKAVTTSSGVLVQPTGKPYFLQVIVAGASGIDNDKAAEVAKLFAK